MQIKSYYEFINELVITSHKSNSGSSREIDTIVSEPSSNKSLSSSIMLKSRLRDEEEVELKNIKRVILRAYRNNMDRLMLAINNLNFLKNELVEHKILKCEYCKKEPLIIYDSFSESGEESEYLKYTKFKAVNGATCDHKNPRSKGGEKFEKSNLVVCCRKCNSLKGNMAYEDWLYFMQTHDLNNLPIKNREYLRVLDKIKSNRIFKITFEVENKILEFEVVDGYEYLNIDKIILSIIRKSKLEKIGDKKI